VWYLSAVGWSYYAEIVSTLGAAAALAAAVGALLNNRKIDETNRKVDVLTGRVDEHGRLLQAIVTATMLRPPVPANAPPPSAMPEAPKAS